MSNASSFRQHLAESFAGAGAVGWALGGGAIGGLGLWVSTTSKLDWVDIGTNGLGSKLILGALAGGIGTFVLGSQQTKIPKAFFLAVVFGFTHEATLAAAKDLALNIAGQQRINQQVGALTALAPPSGAATLEPAKTSALVALAGNPVTSSPGNAAVEQTVKESVVSVAAQAKQAATEDEAKKATTVLTEVAKAAAKGDNPEIVHKAVSELKELQNQEGPAKEPATSALQTVSVLAEVNRNHRATEAIAPSHHQSKVKE